MSEARTAITPDSKFLQEIFQWYEKADASVTKTQKWSWCWYNIENLAQDQVIIRIDQGSRIDTYRGLHMGTDEDSQSDYTYALSIRLRTEKLRDFLDLVKQRVDKKIDLDWESDESFADEESARSVAVEEKVGGRAVDTATDDVWQWTSDQLASSLLHPQAESDMPHLREMILFAEDTGFTVDQSKQLAPWLLSFAQKYRDSNDPQDEAAVWSAIRTGASMLTPHDTDGLRALLEPLHSIETSLVTVKMLGRIFEAQPPADVDEHQDLADEVCQIAESLLDPYAITASQSAAMAQLAIYALVAMASSKTQQIVETVQQLGVTWFTQQTLRELCELRSIWSSRPVPVADRPQELLYRAIQALE